MVQIAPSRASSGLALTSAKLFSTTNMDHLLGWLSNSMKAGQLLGKCRETQYSQKQGAKMGGFRMGQAREGFSLPPSQGMQGKWVVGIRLAMSAAKHIRKCSVIGAQCHSADMASHVPTTHFLHNLHTASQKQSEKVAAQRFGVRALARVFLQRRAKARTPNLWALVAGKIRAAFHTASQKSHACP